MVWVNKLNWICIVIIVILTLIQIITSVLIGTQFWTPGRANCPKIMSNTLSIGVTNESYRNMNFNPGTKKNCNMKYYYRHAPIDLFIYLFIIICYVIISVIVHFNYEELKNNDDFNKNEETFKILMIVIVICSCITFMIGGNISYISLFLICLVILWVLLFSIYLFLKIIKWYWIMLICVIVCFIVLALIRIII
tara:strand:- start:6046 stop:6627 length:582 start_codon:yes stop_codon:yes gene_type:complete